MSEDDLVPCAACLGLEEHQIGSPYCLGRLNREGPALADRIAKMRRGYDAARSECASLRERLEEHEAAERNREIAAGLLR